MKEELLEAIGTVLDGCEGNIENYFEQNVDFIYDLLVAVETILKGEKHARYY